MTASGESTVRDCFRRPATERLAMLVGYLQLARREFGVMIRDSERMGNDNLASGIAVGNQLVSEIIDDWYDDIADDVAASVERAEAKVRQRKEDEYPF